MHFLYTGCYIRGYNNIQIAEARHLPARSSRKAQCFAIQFFSRFKCIQDSGAVATGRDPDKLVARLRKGFQLAGKNVLVTVIICN